MWSLSLSLHLSLSLYTYIYIYRERESLSFASESNREHRRRCFPDRGALADVPAGPRLSGDMVMCTATWLCV